MQKILYGLVLLSSFCLLRTAPASEGGPAGRPEKPNVVLILTDDLGWQDVHCYDIDAPSPMETPNIDRLASQGVMFWQAYSPAPDCAPTRRATRLPLWTVARCLRSVRAARCSQGVCTNR